MLEICCILLAVPENNAGAFDVKYLQAKTIIIRCNEPCAVKNKMKHHILQVCEGYTACIPTVSYCATVYRRQTG